MDCNEHTIKGKIYSEKTLNGKLAAAMYLNPYLVAVRNGYGGSFEQWLKECVFIGDVIKFRIDGNGCLIGIFDESKTFSDIEPMEVLKGKDGKTAYEIAVDNGFEGSESEWVESLKGAKGDKGDAFTFEDFTEEQLNLLKGKPFTYDDFTTEQLEALKGNDGKTPVKGTDYWTKDDIDLIKEYVDEVILGGSW